MLSRYVEDENHKFRVLIVIKLIKMNFEYLTQSLAFMTI